MLFTKTKLNERYGTAKMINSSSFGTSLHVDSSEKYLKRSTRTLAHSVFYVTYKLFVKENTFL
jgi:hypothetical protein